MVERVQDAETGIVHGENGSWDLFAIKDWVVQEYGLFDENLYPAYCEDMDYGMRFKHRDLKRNMSVGKPYYHGETSGDYADGSQTWRSDPSLAMGIHRAHEMNKQYFLIRRTKTESAKNLSIVNVVCMRIDLLCAM